MKRVLVLSIDPSEATYRLRIAILPELLGPEGFEFDFHVRPKSFRERGRLIAGAGDYHAVILQRKLLDPSHARLLRKKSRRIFYDIDDAVMVQRREIGLMSRWLKQRRYLATAKVVDHVVAGNEYLAEQFRRLGCNVTVLPTVIDPKKFSVKRHLQTDRPALVWIGSASTLPYLRQCMPALESAARQIPGLRLITIANDTVPSDKIAVEHIPWTLDGEAQALLRGDIGIAPTPVDQWTIGKSGFKIIQYMAAGLPIIASPVGANQQLVVDGETGLLPGDWTQWPTAIARLASDIQLREQMGAAARKAVEDHYTLARAKAVWKKLLDG